MSERRQINVSWTLPDENWDALEKIAVAMNLPPGQIARILLGQRLSMWRDGLHLEDQKRELAVRVACCLNEKGLDRLDAFIRGAFPDEVEEIESAPKKLLMIR